MYFICITCRVYTLLCQTNGDNIIPLTAINLHSSLRTNLFGARVSPVVYILWFGISIQIPQR